MYTIEDQIQDTWAKIRPFIQRDGGDVEFVSYQDGIVFIRLKGACEGCIAIDDTIKYSIGVLLKDEVPGVIDVMLAPKEDEQQLIFLLKKSLEFLEINNIIYLNLELDDRYYLKN